MVKEIRQNTAFFNVSIHMIYQAYFSPKSKKNIKKIYQNIVFCSTLRVNPDASQSNKYLFVPRSVFCLCVISVTSLS